MEKWVERIEDINNRVSDEDNKLPLSEFCKKLEGSIDSMDLVLSDFQESLEAKSYTDWTQFISNFLRLNKIIRGYQNNLLDKLQSRLGYKEINNEYASHLLVKYLENKGFNMVHEGDWFKFTKEDMDNIEFTKDSVCDDLITSIIELVEMKL